MTARAILSRPAILLGAATALVAPSYPQDLVPRAYVITPYGSRVVLVSASFNKGAVMVDPSVPLDDAKSSFLVPALGYYQSLGLLGRSANISVLVPYVRGDFEGKFDGALVQAYRSGLPDARMRFSVNLHGGPAMNVGEYVRWAEKGLIGASLTMTIPSGQYDPARLINPGANRWGFKPEIGITRRWGHWAVDWYTGAWLFTGNGAFYPGGSVRSQKPIGAVEGHLGYYVRPRLWASLDANFWAGDRSIVDGIQKLDAQRNSRIGGTVSFPVSRRHSFKFSYSQGVYITIGGDFKTLSAAWQYAWITQRR